MSRNQSSNTIYHSSKSNRTNEIRAIKNINPVNMFNNIYSLTPHGTNIQIFRTA